MTSCWEHEPNSLTKCSIKAVHLRVIVSLLDLFKSSFLGCNTRGDQAVVSSSSASNRSCSSLPTMCITTSAWRRLMLAHMRRLLDCFSYFLFIALEETLIELFLRVRMSTFISLERLTLRKAISQENPSLLSRLFKPSINKFVGTSFSVVKTCLHKTNSYIYSRCQT